MLTSSWLFSSGHAQLDKLYSLGNGALPALSMPVASLALPHHTLHITRPAQTFLFFGGAIPYPERIIVSPNGPVGITYFNPKTPPPAGAPLPPMLPPAPTATGTSTILSPGTLQHLKQPGVDYFDASLGLVTGDEAL